MLSVQKSALFSQSRHRRQTNKVRFQDPGSLDRLAQLASLASKATGIRHHHVRPKPSHSTTTRSARNPGTSHRNSSVAAIAPASCAATNHTTSAGRIPANVSLRLRAMVTAGFANDVDAVNQYAA